MPQSVFCQCVACRFLLKAKRIFLTHAHRRPHTCAQRHSHTKVERVSHREILRETERQRHPQHKDSQTIIIKQLLRYRKTILIYVSKQYKHMVYLNLYFSHIIILFVYFHISLKAAQRKKCKVYDICYLRYIFMNYP